MLHNVRKFFIVPVITLLLLPAIAAGGTEVPFQGAFIGTETSFPISSEPCFPGFQRINAAGTGVVSHLGKTTWTEVICIDTASLRFTTTAVLTAADGDQLFFTVTSGQGSPDWWNSRPVMSFKSDWIFSGGTGRFRNATGAGTATGVADFFGPSPHTMVGTISNIGQAKKSGD